jgi:hypothetical protein
MHAWCLDALAAVAIDAEHPTAAEVVAQLETRAARGDFRELVVRAALHRARLERRRTITRAVTRRADGVAPWTR